MATTNFCCCFLTELIRWTQAASGTAGWANGGFRSASSSFLPARSYATARYYLSPVVCLSVCPPVRHKFVLSVVLEWLGGSGWFSAWRISSTHPTSCCKEIRNLQKYGHFCLILNFVAELWT